MKFTFFLFLLFHLPTLSQIHEYKVVSESKIEYFITIKGEKAKNHILYYSVNKYFSDQRCMAILECNNSNNDFVSIFFPEINYSYKKKVIQDDSLNVIIDGINCDTKRISFTEDKFIVDNHFEIQIVSEKIKKDSTLTISVNTFLPKLKMAYAPTYLFDFVLKSFPMSLSEKQEFKKYIFQYQPNLTSLDYNYYQNAKQFKKETFEKYLFKLYKKMIKIENHKGN